MSPETDNQQQRISVLEGRVDDDHLESIKNGGSAASSAGTGGSAGAGDGVDVVEALSSYSSETLDDVDAIEGEIEALQEKLDRVGRVLPESRCAEVRGEIEALRAAADAHSPVRTNTPEALASRIEVRDL